MKKRHNSISPVLAVVLLVLLTLVLYHGVLFRPGVVYGQDTVVQGYPLAWFQSQVSGFWATPGWCPYMMSGFPFPPSSPIYPTDLVIQMLPFTRAMTWRYPLHTIAGALLMFLMLRRFGRSSVASLVGGMTFAFSAFFISKVYAGHGGVFWSGVWMPLTIMLLDRTIETRQARYAAFAGGALGLQMLGGHAQYVFYTVLAAVLFALWRIVPGMVRERGYRLLPKYVGLVAVFAVFAFFIAAPFLLPFAQMTALSNRAGGTGYDYASSMSLRPDQLITALAPSFWGSPAGSNSVFGSLYWDGALFIGVVPLILAAVALFGVKDPRAGYFKALAVLSLLIALGDHTPFFRLVYMIPGFDMIRAPSKILFLYTFAAAALAGYGLDLFLTYAPRLHSARARTAMGSDLQSLPETPNRSARLVTGIFTVAAGQMAGIFLVLLIGHSAIRAAAEKMIVNNRPDASDLVGKLDGLLGLQLASVGWGALLAGGAAVAIVLVMRRIIPARTAAALIAALTFIDLAMYANPLLYTTNPRKAYETGDRAAIKFIQSDPDRFRVLPMSTDVFQYAQGVLDGIESVNGYYPISIARYAEYVGEINSKEASMDVSSEVHNPNSPLVDMLNVKYVLSEKPLKAPNLEQVHSGRTHIYRNSRYIPRVITVHKALGVSGPDEALRAIKRSGFDPGNTLVVESDGKLPPTTGSPVDDRIKVIRYNPNDIRLSVEMGSPGYVLLSEVNYPGWRATIDGKRAEVLQANYLFRAVYLPKGRHDLRLMFVQTLYHVGMLLFTVAVMLIGGMLLQNSDSP